MDTFPLLCDTILKIASSESVLVVRRYFFIHLKIALVIFVTCRECFVTIAL